MCGEHFARDPEEPHPRGFLLTRHDGDATPDHHQHLGEKVCSIVGMRRPAYEVSQQVWRLMAHHPLHIPVVWRGRSWMVTSRDRRGPDERALSHRYLVLQDIAKPL